jgi:hypothetical protein
MERRDKMGILVVIPFILGLFVASMALAGEKTVTGYSGPAITHARFDSSDGVSLRLVRGGFGHGFRGHGFRGGFGHGFRGGFGHGFRGHSFRGFDHFPRNHFFPRQRFFFPRDRFFFDHRFDRRFY